MIIQANTAVLSGGWLGHFFPVPSILPGGIGAGYDAYCGGVGLGLNPDGLSEADYIWWDDLAYTNHLTTWGYGPDNPARFTVRTKQDSPLTLPAGAIVTAVTQNVRLTTMGGTIPIALSGSLVADPPGYFYPAGAAATYTLPIASAWFDVVPDLLAGGNLTITVEYASYAPVADHPLGAFRMFGAWFDVAYSLPSDPNLTGAFRSDRARFYRTKTS